MSFGTPWVPPGCGCPNCDPCVECEPVCDSGQWSGTVTSNAASTSTYVTHLVSGVQIGNTSGTGPYDVRIKAVAEGIAATTPGGTRVPLTGVSISSFGIGGGDGGLTNEFYATGVPKGPINLNIRAIGNYGFQGSVVWEVEFIETECGFVEDEAP